MARPWGVVALLLSAGPSLGEGYSPEAAAARMTLPAGFTATPVAAEPTVRQPVSISFDARGRLWVMQYLQYPNPAGLKAVRRDEWLRTVWDRVPEPPPAGPKGADRLTILSDPDERGVYRKSHDFVNGLNLASGFCIGRGGVYVAQPPYLLFYPDKDEDDVPDAAPEVVLSGFGMEDPHAYANSLQWGPDGWLYGAHGSTVTAKIKNPARPSEPAIEFQQGIWRYHPKTREFELFSEGGGNTWGLDFDRNGQVIAGTNNGGKAMLHQVQGAYYKKGFSKHGPLHNPHAYGYLDHVPYTNFQGGHVTCGGIVYQADAFPPEYRNQYLAANPLANNLYRHEMTPAGSTFTAKHGGDLVIGNDPWFRPVDLLTGPDGAVYVADWYDARLNHVDPVDNWDRTNGRVYRIGYQGAPKVGPFDLRAKSGHELVDLLAHPNKWWRDEARRLLADRADGSVVPRLREQVKTGGDQLALESLWALYQVGGFDEAFAREVVLKHPSEHVRAWGVRQLGDNLDTITTLETIDELVKLARHDSSPVVRCQLACTAKRLVAEHGLELVAELMVRGVDRDDPFIPLLIWWAVEAKVDSDPAAVTAIVWAARSKWDRKLGTVVAERLGRRAASTNPPRWDDLDALLYVASDDAFKTDVIAGVDATLRGTPPTAVPKELLLILQTMTGPLVDRVRVRLGDAEIRTDFVERAIDPAAPAADRVAALELLTQVKAPELSGLLPGVLTGAKSDAVRVAALAAMETTADPKAVELALAGYPAWSPAVKRRAVALLTSRPAWAKTLLDAVDAGSFPKADLSVDAIRPLAADPTLAKLIEKHWGKVGPATSGEKQARIHGLNVMLKRQGLGDPARGQQVFAKTCAACHKLFGEGGLVGPDLTTADRKSAPAMLAHVIDPSGYIRPEFVSYTVNTADGRALTGLVTEAGGEVTVTTVVNGQPQKTVVPKADVDGMAASPVSLMPEKLLDDATDAEVRDLFAFLAADAPPATPAAKPQAAKKLKVVLVSGSFEYKSDPSLAAFKAHLEKNHPVECVLVSAKSDKDTDLPGLEALDGADLAVLFTRRLQVDGESLERIKKYVASGKPVVGVRTASHGFQKWLDMDKLVFGGDYRNHHKQNVEAVIAPANDAAKTHPVLAGVGGFKTLGGLYKNPAVSPDVTVLLTGTAGPIAEPVAWVRERKLDGGKTQRVFYTSLGTPADFGTPEFVRLLTNGLLWAAGQ
jgi:putative membrane-bound dehydrogenase-like protein